jgi:hypothetical protein
MSIRLIAKDLYRLQKEVQGLTKQLDAASPQERDDLENQLRKGKAERDRMRRILDGRLDRSPKI